MRRTAALALLVLLAGCGGGSGGAKDAGAVSASALADKIGCTGFAADAAASRELFVADSGTCTLGSASLTVYRYSNNSSRDQWIKVAVPNGIGRFVAVDRGVVVSDDQSSADAVKAKIGGTIRTQ